MRQLMITLFASLMLARTVSSASAEGREPYPWCAFYGDDHGGSTNCGFDTLEQCRATIRGVGGSCQLNTLYPEPHSRAKRKRRK
jgi:hypothetical protein